jgi:hypothetical protein
MRTGANSVANLGLPCALTQDTLRLARRPALVLGTFAADHEPGGWKPG